MIQSIAGFPRLLYQAREVFRVCEGTSGRTTGIAPRSESSFARTSLCAAERVITIRLPVKALGNASGTLAAHFFQDRLRARLDEQPRHVLSKLRRLIRCSGGVLLHVLRPVHGTNTRVEQ